MSGRMKQLAYPQTEEAASSGSEGGDGVAFPHKRESKKNLPEFPLVQQVAQQ